jgi:dTDP-4-amino-4,6-dideoxygalactose transaminase
MIRQEYLAFGRPNYSSEEIDAVVRIMKSGWVGMGSETIALEKELAEFIGAPYVLTVNSCTSALLLSLLVHGVGPGDEIICPSLTWCSTANAANYCGATPVLCDVDPQTFSVTPETISAAVTPRTKAVMVVHYGGLAVDVSAIRRSLPEHISIIEDAAHALGSRYPDGASVGSSGNLTCFSFYANKNLSTGEGGAIAIHDERQAAHLHSLSRQGLSTDAWKRFTHPQTALVPGIAELGYKMNYMDLLACIGRVQLRRQREFSVVRRQIAEYMSIIFRRFPVISGSRVS